MNMNNKTVRRPLHRMRSLLHEAGLERMHGGKEPPLRSELLSADQMEQHGESLANSHTLSPGRAAEQQLLTRLAENEVVLLEVRNLLTEAVKTNRRITPAGEWLLDNFYL